MAHNVASGAAVAPAGGELTLLAGPVSGNAPQVVVWLNAPVASSVEVYTHPVGPPPPGLQVGTYYPFATQVAIATAAFGPGDQAVLLTGGDQGRGFRQIGVTIRSDDPATIFAHVDIFSVGDGAEG